MPFGEHRSKELELIPCRYLQWLSRIDPKPSAIIKPEKREQYHKERLALKLEANRILRERALNNVTVLDDGKFVPRRQRYRSNRQRQHLGRHP